MFLWMRQQGKLSQASFRSIGVAFSKVLDGSLSRS